MAPGPARWQMGFWRPYDTLNGGALRCLACAVAMPFNHCFHDLDNLFLLTTWQPGGGLKYQLQPAFGSLAFWLWRRDAQQFIHADAQGVRQLRQHFPTRRCAAQFPKRDVGINGRPTVRPTPFALGRQLVAVQPVVAPRPGALFYAWRHHTRQPEKVRSGRKKGLALFLAY